MTITKQAMSTALMALITLPLIALILYTLTRHSSALEQVSSLFK